MTPEPARPAAAAHLTCPLARRRFLAVAAGGIAGCALARRAAAATDRPFDVGELRDYPRDGISEKYVQHDVFVIRHGAKLFACTAVCPHKANLLLADPKAADQIICSGHDSIFSLEGVPKRGPARRALERYAITRNPAGRIMVDPSRSFRQAQWDDPASFIALPAAPSP
jgi:nitrite reductase/ring-hydroxylating ferredoxin subunit